MNLLSDGDSPACSESPTAEGSSYSHRSEELRREILSVRELADGYALRLAAPKPILTLLELLPLERLAPRFLKIGLTIERDDSRPWVRITGSRGVKEFLRAELFGS